MISSVIKDLKMSLACMWVALNSVPLRSLFETQYVPRRKERGQDMSESQRLGGAAYRANTL